MFYLSTHTVNCRFHSIFSDTFFKFLCSLLVISLFKIVPKHGAEVVSSIPKYENDVTCFMAGVPKPWPTTGTSL